MRTGAHGHAHFGAWLQLPTNEPNHGKLWMNGGGSNECFIEVTIKINKAQKSRAMKDASPHLYHWLAWNLQMTST